MAITYEVNGKPASAPPAGIEPAPLSDEQQALINPFVENLGGTLARREAERQSEEAVLTEAQRRLRRLMREPERPAVETREIAGETWYIKRLSFPELTVLGAMTPRDPVTLRLDLSSTRDTSLLFAAMLYCCCVEAPGSDVGFFATQSEAYEFVTCRDSAVAETVAALFTAIADVNPDIFPDSAARRQAAEEHEREKKD